MSRDFYYGGGWAPYVSVAERRRQAQREMEKLRKKGYKVAPVIIEGRTIATTFWGKAWCENLEKYLDFENRLARGRTYVRNGSVVDLQIAPLKIEARVSGSSMYQVSVTIAAVSRAQWESLCRDCTGGIDSLVELLQGRFSKAIMERLCRQKQGLFPTASEIKFSCTCPDYAVMCKHVAAVLYGVGARLDQKPELLFLMRSVDERDLLARVDTSLPLSKGGPAADKVLDTDDLSGLFGLEMAESPGSTTVSRPRTTGQGGRVQKRVESPRVKAAAPVKKPGRTAAASEPAPVQANGKRGAGAGASSKTAKTARATESARPAVKMESTPVPASKKPAKTAAQRALKTVAAEPPGKARASAASKAAPGPSGGLKKPVGRPRAQR